MSLFSFVSLLPPFLDAVLAAIAILAVGGITA